MICITGVPSTGKSTVSAILRERGYNVGDAAEIASQTGCLESGTVDVDCLDKQGVLEGFHAIQGHFSHLMNCSSVVILEASESILRTRMLERGYDEQKIQENIDAQLSGTIYYEAMERLPAGRILTIRTDDSSPEEVSEVISRLIDKDRKRYSIDT